MRLSLLILVPVVITILIVSFVPLPSFDNARKINITVNARLEPNGTPDVRLKANWTLPSYTYHMNSFWFRSVRENSPPTNYSWSLEVNKLAEAGTVEWKATYYWPYNIKGAYWLNVTYSFEGEVGDRYAFVVRLHYELPIGSGDVEGIVVTGGIYVSS